MSDQRYFDPQGKPLALMEWAEMFERRSEDMSRDSWWRRQTTVGDADVSTVWLGMNHSWGDGPPLIWETMIFRDGDGEEQWRYSTREQALDDHERIVRDLREGREP